ncbi:hypothetical protein RFN57_03245 [Streptomyces violaceochromogenes]|uniref:Uncharacterized protein n=1 Tax=Streptomyces violaceochromogenes TaxID=67377 RepID=A0ABU6LT35_9ACTN|nr:hypothetical protein [Streptomyces violaceochromogenes]
MATKMSAEFASAMVTVIPLVMLMCAAEAKVVYAYWDNKAEAVVAAAIKAFEAGEVPEDPVKFLVWIYSDHRGVLPWVTSMLGVTYWLFMAAAHFLAEAGLILWLASARPPGVEYLDDLVVWTAIWGFGHATVLGTLIVFFRVPLRLVRAAREQVDGVSQAGLHTRP